MPTKNPHIVLACVEGGQYIQVGTTMQTYDGALSLYDVLDREISGYDRDQRGRLHGPNAPKIEHTLGGQRVKFYRVRHVEPAQLVSVGPDIIAVDNITREFGHVPAMNLRRLGRRAVK